MMEEALRRQRQEDTKEFIRNFLIEKEQNKLQKIQEVQEEDRKIQVKCGSLTTIRSLLWR